MGYPKGAACLCLTAMDLVSGSRWQVGINHVSKTLESPTALRSECRQAAQAGAILQCRGHAGGAACLTTTDSPMVPGISTTSAKDEGALLRCRGGGGICAQAGPAHQGHSEEGNCFGEKAILAGESAQDTCTAGSTLVVLSVPK